MIHLLAQTFISNLYRQIQRLLENQPTWLNALGLKKVPNHTALSKFRKSKGIMFFNKFFHRLTAILRQFGLIKEDLTVSHIDSAPLEAFHNFARSNARFEINRKCLREFSERVDFSPAVDLLAPACHHGCKHKYSHEVILKYIVYEALCGVLSRSQALKYLKKHPQVASIVGFINGKVTSQATINNYLKRMSPISWLMWEIMEQMTAFSGAYPEHDDDRPLSFFFPDVS